MSDTDRDANPDAERDPFGRLRGAERIERDKRERLAYMGTLASSLGHEIRTPLNAIRLNAQLLAEDSERLPPEWRSRFVKRCRRVYSETDALLQMLGSFLAFTRPPQLDPTPTDLNLFLRETLEFAAPEMDAAGIVVEARLAEDMYPVVLDRMQFSHVVLNILKNAREAIEGRREREAEEFEGRIRVSTSESDEWIALAIEDNGGGIPEDKAERVFDIFYTTKEKGTGLGLGIVRRIVEEHRGAILVDTTSTAGARFVVTLPRGRFLEFHDDGA